MKKTLLIVLMGLALSLTACQGTSTSYETDTTTKNVSGHYIANRNSGKLHYYTCDSLPEEHNRVYFDSEAEANRAGYTDNHKECMGK